jgi:hypothetical protein
MAPPFEDIVIVDLDVQKTTWSRVHSAMRTLYLRLSRDPDLAWTKFFFEERNSRVEVKRHGLWIEEGYIVFDCLLIDVDNHHLPDIRRSITYANERSHELRASQREEREQLRAKARDEAEVLKSLRANIRDERDRSLSDSPETANEFAAEVAPEPDTAHSLEEEAHAQLQPAAEPELTPVPMLPDYEARLQPTKPPSEFLSETSVPEMTGSESSAAQSVPPETAAEAEPRPAEASELDLEFKRSDWRARFRAAFERNKN